MKQVNELPTGWKVVPLQEIANVIRGISFPTNAKAYEPSEGAVVCLRTTNVQKEVDWRDLWYIPRKYVKRDDQFLHPGDVLISTANSYELVGKVSPVRILVHEATLGAFIAAIRCHDEIANPRFLYYQLATSDRQAALRAMASTTTNISNISTGKVKDLPVVLAPMDEQVSIADKIDELFSDLDAGVAALERVKANLKRYRAAVLKAAVEGKLTEQWRAQNPNTEPASKLLERILTQRRQKWEQDQLAKFTAQGKTPPNGWKDNYKEADRPNTDALPSLPRGWCWASVDQVAEVQGGLQKTPQRAPKENAYPYLRVGNVLRNRLDLTEMHQFELLRGELQRLRLEPGDLLVVEGNGSKTEIGRSALWNGEIKDCVHQNHIIRVRLRSGLPQYLNIYWNSPLGNGRIMEKAASTSGLYTLSVGKVSAIPIPFPPLDEQEQIVTEAERRISVLEKMEADVTVALTRGARLRQSILKHAFTGNLFLSETC